MTDPLERTPLNPFIWDPTTAKVISMLDPNGNLNVAVADQTTRPVDFMFLKKYLNTTVAASASIDDKVIQLASTAGIAAGHTITLVDGNDPAVYATTVGVVSVSAPNVTIDTPLDTDLKVGDSAAASTSEMNVNGSVTPQVFTIRGFDISPSLQVTFDVTAINIQITCTDPPGFGEFGDLTALTNGIVLRRTDGDYQNLMNVKSNSDFALLSHDTDFYFSSLPIGINGVFSRHAIAGQQNHGVALRLKPGENLEFIIQDDLSTLLSFRAIAQGHVVN